MTYLLGIDVGSTTVKTAVLAAATKEIVYTSYERHFSRVKECVLSALEKVGQAFPNAKFRVSITGSAGLGLAEKSGIAFVQEVQAAFIAIKGFYPDADVAVELGGEDAKIIFLTGGTEQRMNGSCAGGTGAFIDQMATLLDISVGEMDKLALTAEKVYPIASRCGVFAKSDIQPLINQGAAKADIAASIFRAVVEQTVSGLAQGRKIKGKVLFLGGPLHFLKALRAAFTSTLNLDEEHAIFPENAPVFIATGAALANTDETETGLEAVIKKIRDSKASDEVVRGKPLFENRSQYEEFVARHKRSDLEFADIRTYQGDAYLGIDSGSTTTKLMLITSDCRVLYSHYQSNNGQPLDIVVEKLREMYSLMPKTGLIIRGAAVTGYGEDMLRAALKMDFGIVETVAHFKAAVHFNPLVDFIIDIGGQDIKCFKVKNGAIDSIMLNEACSSGCGSFIQTFAKAMDMDVESFARLGLFAKKPVELGSRCTVFMNSAVKQAQKEGASVEDISAGLSSSIVKNAVYKVIRAKTPEELGKHIVAQGGTFINDAVLRSFEMETGRQVVRPAIAGLMGAFGAALYAKETQAQDAVSTLLSAQDLEKFSYKSRATNCKGCTSNCNINILTFEDGGRFISGNKCERGAGQKPQDGKWNIYEYKYERLLSCVEQKEEGRYEANEQRGVVGLPFQLVMFEQLPFWTAFFKTLRFEVKVSERSSRGLYFKGQHTVASDTVCYPAKLMHGHIESLLNDGVDFIFYPCESYNVDEKSSTNHYNCPIVAYYAELLKANNERLTEENFLSPYVDLNERKTAVRNLYHSLQGYGVTKKEISLGLRAGFTALQKYQADVRAKGKEILSSAREAGKQTIVLVGRPYHADPEINHGIGKLISSLGLAVISEDSIADEAPIVEVNVLNQWTYHARLYRAAEYACRQKDVHLVQLVSFGCGIDALTTDEIRTIMESNGKLYTQIKIDEINNLGVVKIRLRSLVAAINQ
ncbi:MAG: 2-hydroxyglutaryl-CoA dehydratase [Clostridiales bacterium]|nr:2-hydroxyglutaryl-CoA dehydratase [Clostridiales bacterium]